MRLLPLKIKSFFKQLKKLESAGSGAREKEAHRLAETMCEKDIYLFHDDYEYEFTSYEIEAESARLEDIHHRLELTIKSGLVSETIH